LRDEILELKLVFQDTQQQRDFEPHKNADNHDLSVQNQPKTLQIRKHNEENGGR